MTEDTILNNRMSLISTTNEMKYEITNDTCLVHFIAPPLDAKTKLAFIEKFEKDRNKSFLQKLINKIKKFFKRIFRKNEQPITY
jgi:hypothetical protein